jgi:hypothetical protein
MPAVPILVTGTHRSGTTWVGEILSLDSNSLYIHEPFNVPLQLGRGRKTPISYWYQMVDASVEEAILKYLLDFQKLKPGNILYNSYRRNPTMSMKWLRLSGNANKRYLYKDPLALLSAPWFAAKLHARVVVMVRHPAAFAASLKVKNWNFPFMDLAEQPGILDHIPQNWREGVLQFAHSKPGIVEQAALLWNILHYFIREYKDKYPDWIFVRHEDLSADPVEGFRNLYEALGLAFSEKIAQAVLRSSTGEMPADSVKTNVLQRNSVANIKSWKNRLTAQEVQFLRDVTADISGNFYTEEDW